jgi:serine/threonine protein kinase
LLVGFIEMNEIHRPYALPPDTMVQEYQILEKRGILPEAELKRLLEPLLDGIERIHEASVWHRDIKPSNILIRPDGPDNLHVLFSSRIEPPFGQALFVAITSQRPFFETSARETGDEGGDFIFVRKEK